MKEHFFDGGKEMEETAELVLTYFIFLPKTKMLGGGGISIVS